MNATRCVEGEVLTLTETFLDESDYPLIPLSGTSGPTVRVLDADRSLITESIADVDTNEQGSWRVDLPIPELGLTKPEQFTVIWHMVDEESEHHRSKVTITVEPAAEERIDEVIVLEGQDAHMTIALPFELIPSIAEVPSNPSKGIHGSPAVHNDLLTVSLFCNNQALMQDLSYTDPSIRYEVMGNRTMLQIPNVMGGNSIFQPCVLTIKHLRQGQFSPTTYTFTTWNITPQILLACNELEAYVNKARIDNIIPALDYAQGDLIRHLYHGLQRFNAMPPQLTNFNGRNMQGIIFESWLLCSIQHLLIAQLQAEGAHSFDFGGQDVSLNMDRTQAIESTLGRIEQMVSENVPQTKKLLAKAGVSSGDGSQGSKFMDGRNSIGALSLINAPTTRVGNHRRASSFYMRSF
jgi:hypothetical protein